MGNQTGNSQNMRNGSFLLLVLSVALLSGCGIVRHLAATTPVAPSVSYKSIQQSRGFRLSKQGFVFRSLADIEQFAAAAGPDDIDKEAYSESLKGVLGSLDFSKEQGILFCFGDQSSTCFSGEISAIEEKTDRLIVHPVLIQFTGNACGDMVVAPYHYVSMPRSEKPIEFAAVVLRERPRFSIF